MNEYEVGLVKGTAWIYAETYDVVDGEYVFYDEGFPVFYIAVEDVTDIRVSNDDDL